MASRLEHNSRVTKLRGFILQASYRVQSGPAGTRVPVIHVYGRLEDGGTFLVRDNRQRPHFYIRTADLERASALFGKVRGQQALAPEEVEALRWRILHDLAVLDHKRGWVLQLHIGALRNNNTRMLARLGLNTGFDSIGDAPVAGPLARMLDALDGEDKLPKTILYNLNPRDNEVFATMIGNFQDGSIPGKLQYGSGWWFLDQLDGMEKQINALSNMGLLSRFVGMLTDSRSFLSYSRHEYFRRLLCNLLGNDVRRGLLPGRMAITLRSSTGRVMRPPCGIWCVSKLTWRRLLERCISSRIHWRAAPIPRVVESVPDSVLRVPKLTSFSRS